LCGMYCPDFAICASKVDPPKQVESAKGQSTAAQSKKVTNES
jgi:hypothetical protein